jgi:hypothetical protein
VSIDVTSETFPIFCPAKENDAIGNQYMMIIGDPRGSEKAIALTYHKAKETTTLNSFRAPNHPFLWSRLSTTYATL